MAEQGMFDLTKPKEVAKDVAGGYISGTMDVAGGAKDMAMRLPAGILFRIINRIRTGEDPNAVFKSLNQKELKQAADALTNLPVSEASGTTEASKLARAAGEGAAGPLGPGGFMAKALSAGIGAISNMVAETVSPDSPAGKFFTNLGVNFGLNAATRGVRKIASGGAMKPIEAPTDIPLTRSEATNSNLTTGAENAAATSTASLPGRQGVTLGDEVAQWTKDRADKAKKVLEDALKTGKTPAQGAALADQYTAIKDQMIAQHKRATDIDMTRAQVLAGRGSFVNLDPVHHALTTLIEKYRGINQTPQNQRKLQQLITMRDNVNLGQRASMNEVKNAMQQFGDVAFGKGDIFTEIAPGSSVGEAKLLGGAWKEALKNSAADPNLNSRQQRAAQALLLANDKFAERLNTINNWAEQPLSKELLETAATRPEDVVSRIQRMTPTERSFLTTTLRNNQGSGVLEQVRKAFAEKLMGAGDVAGFSTREPTFNMRGFLAEFDNLTKKDPAILDFMFPASADKANFLQKVATVRKAVTDAPAQATPKVGELLTVGAGQAASNYTIPGRAAAGAFEGLKMVFKDKNVVFQSLFNPEIKATDMVGKALQVAPVRYARELAKGGLSGNVVGQASVGRPEDDSDMSFDAFLRQQEPSTGPTAPSEAPQATQVPTEAPTGPIEEPIPVQDDSDMSFEAFLATQKPEKKSKLSLEDAIRKVESGGNEWAFNPKSGAMGADQIMPHIAAKLGVNPLDIDQATKGKKILLDQIKGRYGYNLDKVLAAYNWGQGNLEKYGMDKQPEETKKYIARVKKEMGIE